jgi:hypothetical protein
MKVPDIENWKRKYYRQVCAGGIWCTVSAGIRRIVRELSNYLVGKYLFELLCIIWFDICTFWILNYTLNLFTVKLLILIADNMISQFTNNSLSSSSILVSK